MGRIIHLFGDRHRDALRLLPWYVTGQLDHAERELVDSHLAGCAACRTELGAEQRLRTAVSTLPVDLDTVWVEDHRTHIQPRRFGPVALGWFLAGQCAIALLFLAVTPPPQEDALYRGLGSAAEAPGSMIIMFRPEASEQSIRDTLIKSGTRIVDGPTAAGAYVLSIPADNQSSVLQELRMAPAVLLAQPMDAEAHR